MPITIRPVETQAEFIALEGLQAEIWPGDKTDVVPRHLLLTAAHNGGLALGAFDDDRLVGFVFGFLGADEADPSRPAMARLKHCSHMLGVLPGYRDQDIGYRLKLAQRDFVMKQGVRLVTWTYDPLESRNAYLNIARLGAVCRTYAEDVYGPMADRLNAGLASDRFQVDWWITSARVRERLEGQRAKLVLESFTSAGAEILNPTSVAPDDGLPRPAHRLRSPESTFALAEIPYDFQSIKMHDMTLAREWRAQTRALFESAFARGYLVTDFLTTRHEGRPRSFYALAQGE
jgi:predicted GNAT superfamily acetyltransferase